MINQNFAWRNRLDRLVVARTESEAALMEMLELGMYVALLAPVRSGRSTLLRSLRVRFEAERPGGLFVLVRPDQSADLPRETFLQDFLGKLKHQLSARGIQLQSHGDDPYLSLKNALASLPTHTPDRVIVALDDLGRIDPRHLGTLLWVFRELHSQRADEGWEGPLGRLAVVVAGSRKLYNLTVGHENLLLSPFNVAEIYQLPDFSPLEMDQLLHKAQQENLVQITGRAAVVRELERWTGGNPLLIKAVLAASVQGGASIQPEQVPDLARAALAHDRTLLELWERLSADPDALEMAAKIYLHGLRPPANLEMAEDTVRIIYWLGLLTTRDGLFEPRCKMMEEFFSSRLSAHRPNGSSATAPSVAVPIKPSTQLETAPPVPIPSSRFPEATMPEGLLRGLAQGSGVLFVGAGASCAAGLPTWAELSQGMTDRILGTASSSHEREQLSSFIVGGGPLAVAQMLRERIGTFDYHQFLVDTLRRPVPLAPVHRALRRLPIRLILTTNFDKLLEKAYRLPDGDDPPVVISTPQLASIQEQKGHLVVKLHGDIDHPDTIVLTSDDYLAYFDRHQALRAFLEYQFSHRTVLFVGFGLKDPNFDLIFEEARRTLMHRGRPAYAVMVGTNPFEIERWKARGIHIIDLPTFDEIPPYLEALADRATHAAAQEKGASS